MGQIFKSSHIRGHILQSSYLLYQNTHQHTYTLDHSFPFLSQTNPEQYFWVQISSQILLSLLEPYHTTAVLLGPNLSKAVIFSSIFLSALILRQNHSSAFTFGSKAYPFEAKQIARAVFFKAIAFILGAITIKSTLMLGNSFQSRNIQSFLGPNHSPLFIFVTYVSLLEPYKIQKTFLVSKSLHITKMLAHSF